MRSTIRTRRSLIAGLVLTVVLAACGGGSDSTGNEDEPTTTGSDSTGNEDEPTTTGSDTGAATSTGADDGGEAVTLTWLNWATAEESTRPNVEALISTFEEEHPNVTIESVPVGFSDIPTQAITMISQGNSPDIVQVEPGYTAQLAAEGLLAPLDELAGQEYLDRLIPEVLEPATVEDQLVAVPWFAAPFALWYNRVLMEEAGLDPESPPATLDEMTSAMQQVSETNPDALGFGLDTTNRTFGLTHNWAPIRAHGAVPFTADGTVSADSQEMQDYLEWVGMLVSEGYTQRNKKLGDFRNLAAQGDLLFAFDGPYLAGTMQSINSELDDEALFETWGVAPFPAGGNGESVTVPTDHQLAIVQTSENQDVAWEFVEFMTSSEQAVNDYVLPLGGLPPFTDATETYDGLDNPIATAYYEDVIPTVVTPPFGAEYAEAATAVMTGVQRMFEPDADAAQVATTMQAELESVFGG